jgi:small-conductance mechanosensitive channel
LLLGLSPAAISVTAASPTKSAQTLIGTNHAPTERYREGKSLPNLMERDRTESEEFWSGAAAKAESDDVLPVHVHAAKDPPLRSSRLKAAAGALALPLATVPHWVTAAAPYAQAAAAMGGAYSLIRAARWAIDKLAPRVGWDKQDVVVRRFLSGVGFGLLGVVVAVSLVDVPSIALAAIGAGGTVIALAITPVLRDVLGNLFHGVHFLLARPFRIGDKVTIGKITGVVDDMTMRYLILKDENGSPIKLTHNMVAAAAATVYGQYAIKTLKAPALWKPIVFSALAIAALAFFPLLQTAIKGTTMDWLTVILPYLKGGLILTLTSGVSRVISAGIQRAKWSRPVKMAGKLAATVLTWIVGIGFLIAVSGISSAWLAGTLPLVIVGIAVNDYVSAAIQLFFLLTDKTFKIGDRVKIGEHEGVVLDITLQDVVLELNADTFMRIPHSVVKESAITKLNAPGATAPDSKEK